ncbi:hypothetical protein CN439_25005 [Bacillus cereus]|uniref:hypothetical protein n=1 Tax=Bacillus cereus TaxID=1396 RepID=UPI000BF2B8E7|nr:hypothetical protein [Bacillus cereus]MDZ4649456.1 hypothetical protein [Bacillus cereus]PEW11073.1 hypothetical protein CN439_25005 [Bacillus cereus]
MNARQYYYRNNLPRSVGMSYQRGSSIKIKSHRFFKNAVKTLNHLPRLSNDRLIEFTLLDLINNHIPTEFRERLNYLFVAKINDHLYEARAISNPGMYRGDLIYYYVGLSDGFFEFTIFFTKLNYIQMDVDSIIHECFRLSSMTKYWRESYPKRIDIFQEPNDPDEAKYMEKAASIAVLMDKFVICHEIAHHLLGHTGKQNDAGCFLDNLPDELKSWRHHPNEHTKELQADALAVLFMMKMTKDRMKQGSLNDSQDAFNAILGSLFTLKALSFLSENPDETSKDYPSINERLASCTDILSYYTNIQLIELVNEKLEKMFEIISRTETLPVLKERGASDEDIQNTCNLIYLLIVSCKL